MTKLQTIDLFFNSDTKDTRILLDRRKKAIRKVFDERTFPLYGTFGNSLNRDRIGRFELGEADVDFVVRSLDLVNNTAEIEWISRIHKPENFDKLNLCLAYYTNDTDITSLRFAYMQAKLEYCYRDFEVPNQLYGKQLFNFSVALNALKAGQTITRMEWRDHNPWKFVSLTPGTNELPAERFWSPCNKAAVTAYRSKQTGNVKPYITVFNNGDIQTYNFTNDDLLADDWCIHDTVQRLMNEVPPTVFKSYDDDEGPELEVDDKELYKEEVIEKK